MAEGNEKINTTKEEIKEIVTEVIENAFSGQKFKDSVEGIFEGQKFKDSVEGIFEGQKFKDSVEDVVMGAIANFNTYDLKPELEKLKNDLKQEIKVSEQANKDWTDKRVEQAEGRIIPKINILVDILEEKDIIGIRDVDKIHVAGAQSVE